MKLLILKDSKISFDEMKELERQFDDIYYENAAISPKFFIEEVDYTDYPTTIDGDGDVRLSKQYIDKTVEEVYKRFSGEGTDHVVFLIHEDNWKSDPAGPKGIWGTSYSNIFKGYQVQYCRFDRDNMANSLGTLFHEVMHSHDVFIKTYTGIDINKILDVKDYDHEVVHGNNPKYSYIRHKENLDALRKISEPLQKAYAARNEIYLLKVNKMQTIATLLKQMVYLYRLLKTRKNKY